MSGIPAPMNLLGVTARCGAGVAVYLSVTTAAAQSRPVPERSAPAPIAVPSFSPTGPVTNLKSSLTILGANDNNDISLAAPLGTPLPLILFVKEPPVQHPRGELRVSLFMSQGEQRPAIAIAKIRRDTSNTIADTFAPVEMSKQGQTTFFLDFDRLRPGKTYKGQIFLTSGDLLDQWNVTLTTERGTIAVDPVGTLKFVKFPWGNTGAFAFTIYDKSDAGPYHHLRVRFEPSSAANSKAVTSNFILNTLSFWENDKQIDLERRAQERNDSALTLTKARTFSARIESLSPGEYSGALHFAADETSDDAADAKLPLLIQVRHYAILPVIVILIGSAFGWFSSKYVVGVRRARALSQQIKTLHDRAEDLTRSRPAEGWTFPSEAVSLGFARLNVELSLLAALTRSAIEVVFHGDEIEERRKQAEQRLRGLESLHQTRLRVQSCADERPSAQLAIGSPSSQRHRFARRANCR